MQVAAKAPRAGESKFAQELRDLVNELRERTGQRARVASIVPFAQPKGELGRLALNSVTFGNRMRGRYRWKDTELTVSAEMFGLDTSDANNAVDEARGGR